MAHESVYPKLESESDLQSFLDYLYATTKQVIDDNNLPKFKDLMEIAKSEITIITAIHKIKSNHGSKTAGTDSVTIPDILQEQYPEVIEMVRTSLDNYNPHLLRRVWIPKPGKTEQRPLGIPAMIDRIIQEVLRIIIDPIMEAQFFKHSYGFRPMRDAHMALERTTNTCHNTGYSWIIEGDIKGCFDNINHTKLIKQLWHMGIHDRRILMIIKKMLKAGVLDELKITEIGTPQGGIISPLLANVYLHKLDQWIVREWEEKTTKHNYSQHDCKLTALKRRTNLKPAYLIRYADDWILITDSKSNAEKWKKRIEKYLDTNLKLKLSPTKTYITNVKKEPIHFLGFRYKQIKGKSKTGWITLTRPDDERLKAKIGELKNKISQLRKYNGINLIHQINIVNSIITGIGNYYQPATMVNIDLNKYANFLKYTAYKAIKAKKAKWSPANEVNNLINRHEKYTSQIPAIKNGEITVGVTNLGFVKWKKAYLKNPDETPYTPKGRKIYYERTDKSKASMRDDITMSLTLSEYIAKGAKQPLYNFEYLMNRAYAFNRDKGKCKICGEPIAGHELNTHHIDPNLPLNQVNKVPNLASTHNCCHKIIHSNTDVSHLVKKEIWKKIFRFRERLKSKLEIS